MPQAKPIPSTERAPSPGGVRGCAGSSGSAGKGAAADPGAPPAGAEAAPGPPAAWPRPAGCAPPSRTACAAPRTAETTLTMPAKPPRRAQLVVHEREAVEGHVQARHPSPQPRSDGEPHRHPDDHDQDDQLHVVQRHVRRWNSRRLSGSPTCSRSVTRRLTTTFSRKAATPRKMTGNIVASCPVAGTPRSGTGGRSGPPADRRPGRRTARTRVDAVDHVLAGATPPGEGPGEIVETPSIPPRRQGLARHPQDPVPLGSPGTDAPGATGRRTRARARSPMIRSVPFPR